MDADPTRLHRLSARLRHEAGLTQRRAGTVLALTSVPWRSCAANRYRDRVEQVAADLARTARHLELAADLVDAHARSVATVVAEVRRRAVEASELVADAALPRRRLHGPRTGRH